MPDDAFHFDQVHHAFEIIFSTNWQLQWVRLLNPAFPLPALPHSGSRHRHGPFCLQIRYGVRRNGWPDAIQFLTGAPHHPRQKTSAIKPSSTRIERSTSTVKST
jgi:hypothetical protein